MSEAAAAAVTASNYAVLDSLLLGLPTNNVYTYQDSGRTVKAVPVPSTVTQTNPVKLNNLQLYAGEHVFFPLTGSRDIYIQGDNSTVAKLIYNNGERRIENMTQNGTVRVTSGSNTTTVQYGSTKSVLVNDILTIDSYSFTIHKFGSLELTTANVPINACLLKGTKVLTVHGYVPIEQLRKGDYVLNQNNEKVMVEESGFWSHTYEEDPIGDNKLRAIYKVPSGTLKAKSDVFLTYGHRVMRNNGAMALPFRLGLKRAERSEFCDKNGSYTVYHVRVTDGEHNHLIVNGGCVVESWK